MPHHCTRTACPERRQRGWTPERQLTFLTALAATRSVTAAARAAGMSRESAYRLRGRAGNALLAHLWDRALAPPPSPSESHNAPLTDGQLARLLGNDFRRKSGDFAAIGAPNAKPARGSSDANMVTVRA